MFSKTIKNLRESRNWSIRELGERSDIAFTMISRYEKGTAFPKGKSLEKLAKALNVSVKDLTGEAPVKFTQKNFDARKFERSISDARLLDEHTKTFLTVLIEELVEKKKLKDFYISMGEFSRKLQ